MCLCPSNCALCDGGRRKNHSCRTTEVYTVHNTSSSRVVLDQAALKAKPEKETEMLGPRTRGCRIIQHRRGCGSVSDIPPCCAESHAEGKASARRVERQLDERPSLAALSFAPHRETRHLDLHAASSGSSASGLELHPARCTRQGLCTPRRAAARRAACCAEGQAGGTAARPPHAASSGNSASGLELRPARLRGKASARRVERQLGERPQASPRPASRQGLRTPRRAATRRAASSFAPPGFEARPPHAASSSRSASGLELPPDRARNKDSARRAERQLGERPRDSPRPASRQDSCTPRRAAARRTASSLAPPGFVTRSLIMKNPDAYTHLQEEDQDAALRDAQDARPPHAASSGSSATGLELPPARDRGKASAAAGHVSLAGLGDRPRASPRPGSPLHAASSGSSASSLELSSALLRGKASARRVERQLGERPRASPRPGSRQGLCTPRQATARRAASSFAPPSFGDAQYPDVATLQRQAITAPHRPARSNMLPAEAVQGRARTACYTTKETSSARQRHPYGPPAPFHAFRLPAPADPL
eukprot:tig00020796_g13717.t1